jgi:hypothetical protein
LIVEIGVYAVLINLNTIIVIVVFVVYCGARIRDNSAADTAIWDATI